jgi:hypothetical protein
VDEDKTMTPQTNNIPIVPVSAAKPDKRVPNDAFVLLCEIDHDRLSEDELRRYVNLCDAGLRWLDKEFESDLMDPEFGRLCLMPENSFLNEVKMAKRTPLAKKLACARRYRNRRQHILNKKRQADANRVSKVIAKKMALSLKTRTGREKRQYHTESIEWHGDFAEYMKAYHHPPKPEVSETRQGFKINGKVYSVPSSIIESIEEGLVYAIKTGAEHYIQFTDGSRIEVRNLIKAWI